MSVLCGSEWHSCLSPLSLLSSFQKEFLTNNYHRQQPWCTYALHIATFTSIAFIVDPLLLATCWWATGDWELHNRQYAFWAQFVFMFGFTKVVKLMGLLLRNPSDIMFLPVSVLFGYFHGMIKLYSLVTLNMVWISHLPFTASCFFLLTNQL